MAAAFFLVPDNLILVPALETRVEFVAAWVAEQATGVVVATAVLVSILFGTIVVLAIKLARARRKLKRAMLKLDDQDPPERHREDWTFPSAEDAALRRGANPFSEFE